MSFPLDSFRRWAERRPELPAIHHAALRTSYGALLQRADAIAGALLRHGVAAGDRVVLGLEPGAELLAAMIGVMQLGAAYVPIDVRAPAQRNRMIVADSAARLALLDAGAEAVVDRLCPALCPDDVADTPTAGVPRRAGLDPATPAYVIYTSGTTGRPKGVPVSHGNMRALFAATEREFAFSPADRGVLYHSCAFDFSVWEIWSMLGYGGCLCIPDYHQKTAAAEFARFLGEHAITVLNQTPTSFGLNAPEIIRLGAAASSLRCVIFGGERLNMAALIDWAGEFPLDDVAMINMYGITETTVHSSFYRISAADLDRTDSPIGRMLDGFEVALWPVDGEGQAGIGELLLAGPQVTGGYWRRPELTAERFVAIAGDGGTRTYYRTGDLVSRQPDGGFVYHGRIDDQLSINGHRVETGEIEVTLMRGSGVPELAVMAQETEAGPLLVCFFVPAQADDGADPDRTAHDARRALRRCANEGLPVYMRPNKYLPVPGIRRNANGKVDRPYLRSLLASGTGTQSRQDNGKP